jgi:hypothetical protein
MNREIVKYKRKITKPLLNVEFISVKTVFVIKTLNTCALLLEK